MGFRNKIRLPFYISKPQFPAERKVFSLADGSTKTTSIRIRKVFQGETDYLPEKFHEALQIALSHDNKNIVNRRYIGGVVIAEGDYEIAWQDFLDYPLAKAAFKADATPYNFVNSNCMTCEEASQLQLEDDYITGLYSSIDEGDTVAYNVLANDEICCSPIAAQIISFNADYVQSATINAANGQATITLLPTTPSGFNVLLATYRVTCPNGSYDEAGIYANVAGSVIACDTPPQLDAGTITETEATPNWFWPLGTPPNVDHFEYALYEQSNPGSPIDSGSTSSFSVHYTDLNPGTCYIFAVRTVCDDASTSEYVSMTFCTPISTTNCGRYSVTKTDLTAPPGAGPYSYQYINCSGAYVNAFIMNYQTLLICMLESSPGVPVFIENITSYEYVEPCT